MKRKTRILIGITVLLAILLTGCEKERRLREERSLAEAYLTELKREVSDDTLRLDEAAAERFGDIAAFTAYTEKYSGDFRINVSADNRITDSYFAVRLRDGAKTEMLSLLEEVLPERETVLKVALKKNVLSSALSGRLFSSLQEAQTAVGESLGLLQLYCPAPYSLSLPEEELSMLLSALQERGFYGELRLEGDVRVFDISGNGICYTRTDHNRGRVEVYDFEPLQSNTKKEE